MRHVEVLGFTGTIASGKTTRCKHLLSLATRYEATQAVLVHGINADIIGHNIYLPGKPCYDKLLDLFGADILRPSPKGPYKSLGTDICSDATAVEEAAEAAKGRLIDRRALGRIVFADRVKLELLNNTCWPFITAEIGTLLRRLQDEARETRKSALFVLLEAAMLVQSVDLLRLCNSVWVTHCSPDVAVDRVMRRDGLTREEAVQRVESQPSFQCQKAQLARQSFASSVQYFDTSNTPLDVGLHCVEDRFEALWHSRIVPHLA